jgi:tetratricopeptide (TPR) repeat protein
MTLSFSFVTGAPWRSVSILVVLACLALVMPRPCGAADADTIYRQNSRAVVVVISLDEKGRLLGQGSGFLVREDGAVVTNYHVVNLAKTIKVKVGDRTVEAEGLIHADPDNDLAVLKVEGKGYGAVTIGDAGKVRVGERLYVIGSPGGLENTISEGILSGIRRVDATRRVLQMTAPISPGSSGGPVFNGSGEVVGVATFLIAQTQNLNFAVPIDLVAGALTKKTVVPPEEACKLDYEATAGCWFYQGLAFGMTGQHDRAAQAFKRSLDVNTKNPETYVNLGVTYANLGRFADAAEMFGEALKIDPNQQEALSNLGAVYSRLGQYGDALATLNRAAARSPDDAQVQYNLAVTYGRMGRYREAVEAVKEAIRLAPDSAEAQGYLAILYAETGRYSEAAAAFKAAIRLNPDDPRVHLGLGKAYVAMGEKGQALEEYKILKKLNQAMADDLFALIYK